MRLTKTQLEVVRLIANNWHKINPEDIQHTMLQCLIRKGVLHYSQNFTTQKLMLGVNSVVYKRFKLWDNKYKLK